MSSKGVRRVRALAISALAAPLFFGGRMCWAQPVSISFSLAEKSVTLHEPVYVQFSLRNGSREELHVDLGPDRVGGFTFFITQPDGLTVQPQSSRGQGGLSASGEISVPAGQTYSQRLLVNEWYKFSGPGQYSIKPALSTINATVAQPMSLTVEPRNPSRLEDVCRKLADTAIHTLDYQSAYEAGLALSYIDDPIAIPYLGRVLHESKQVKGSAIPGLVRIGNPEAVKVLSQNLTTLDPDLKAQIQGALQEIRTGVHPRAVDAINH
jgi:hypothetical protein